MESKELMVGDWVYFHSTPNKVTTLTASFAQSENGSSLPKHNLHPIPLTEKILKKNGFKFSNAINKEYIHKGYLAFNKCHFVSVMVDDYESRFNLSIAKKTPETETGLGMNIKYVHELQHALRLCGLNELADNFKVE